MAVSSTSSQATAIKEVKTGKSRYKPDDYRFGKRCGIVMLCQKRALESIKYLERNVQSAAEGDPSATTQSARWRDSIEEKQVDENT